MTPDDLRYIRQAWNWTQTQAAAHVGVSGNTWARWERGEVRIHPLRLPSMLRLLRAAQRRAERLATIRKWGIVTVDSLHLPTLRNKQRQMRKEART
jgi:predicted transcriptional regulator